MEAWLSSVCDILTGPAGADFLELMRHVYSHEGHAKTRTREARSLADRAVDLGLLIRNGDRLALSGPGYLMGNVAKEYCNWVDHGRRMPPPRPPRKFTAGKDILDLGCSIGRWLWEFQPEARSVTGLELRPEYIELGRALARRENILPPRILAGSIEDVDQSIGPESMDFIFCRLAMNHVPIRKVLPKIVAVLRPGGILWLEAETFKCGWEKLRRARGAKEIVYTTFGMINSLVCTTTGRQMNISYPGRHQTSHRVAYPSQRWWSATFTRVGLAHTVLDLHEGPFCIWGRKG